jgi:hypothetical protein
MGSLEKSFEADVEALLDECRQRGYIPTYFMLMLQQYGGVETAHRLLAGQEIQYGNPSIAEKPERADEVLYKLRAIVLSVRSDGLITANEEFTAWLRGERSMPFGPTGSMLPFT